MTWLCHPEGPTSSDLRHPETSEMLLKRASNIEGCFCLLIFNHVAAGNQQEDSENWNHRSKKKIVVWTFSEWANVWPHVHLVLHGCGEMICTLWKMWGELRPLSMSHWRAISEGDGSPAFECRTRTFVYFPDRRAERHEKGEKGRQKRALKPSNVRSNSLSWTFLEFRIAVYLYALNLQNVHVLAIIDLFVFSRCNQNWIIWLFGFSSHGVKEEGLNGRHHLCWAHLVSSENITTTGIDHILTLEYYELSRYITKQAYDYCIINWYCVSKITHTVAKHIFLMFF